MHDQPVYLAPACNGIRKLIVHTAAARGTSAARRWRTSISRLHGQTMATGQKLALLRQVRHCGATLHCLQVVDSLIVDRTTYHMRECTADGRTGNGEGLVRAMRHVPPLFFQEQFSLSRCSALRQDASVITQLRLRASHAIVGAKALQKQNFAGSRCRPETWEDVAPSDSEQQRAEALEQLSAHLVRVLHTAHITFCMRAVSSIP